MATEVPISEKEGPLATCARTLAGDGEFELPVGSDFTGADLADQRGWLDALALKHLYHDDGLHEQLAPRNLVHRELFDMFEQERYESIGCNAYNGVQLNLDARESSRCQASASGSLPSADTQVCDNWSAGLRSICRSALRNGGGELTSLSVKQLTKDPTAWTLINRCLPQLLASVNDQWRYAQTVRELLHALSRHTIGPDGSGEWFDNGLNETARGDGPDEGDADTGDDQSGSQFSEQECDESADDTSIEKDGRDSDELPEPVSGDIEQSDSPTEQLVDEAPVAGPDPFITFGGDSSLYSAYTTEFDEVIQAADSVDQALLRQWREELDQHIDMHTRLVRRLASRLQRVLLARQRRHWQFDMEEGQLDASRLSRVVTQPLMPLSFKTESESALRDTTITLLIDNSRSMLGRPIMIAAACADILARTLEQCGVSVEILGFTTAHLHGGRSTELWESRGSPVRPGRLNDLKHIVYKSADTPYRSARRNLGLMLDKDILKQNIDGEALMWAHQRLLKRPQQRRILMTISDGAPVDTSTLGANPGDFLARHLQKVIADIEKSGRVELVAIGIGHDVSRFYPQAMSVYDARQLGPAMLSKLEDLFRQAA